MSHGQRMDHETDEGACRRSGVNKAFARLLGFRVWC
jgi:hypothetical protein